jgi:ribosomal protein L32
MPVPKRKASKSRTKIRTNKRYTKSIVVAVRTKDGKAYKRPHFDERIEL